MSLQFVISDAFEMHCQVQPEIHPKFNWITIDEGSTEQIIYVAT